MLTVKIIAVGKLKESYFADAAGEYTKRLGGYCKCKIVELPEERLPKSPSHSQIEAALRKEGQAVLGVAAGGLSVAMCIDGRRYTSRGLAEFMRETAVSGVSEISFIVGSSHGLSQDVVSAAHETISLSDMTLPHQLCRVVLLEQLYRAFSINAGGKYHK